MELHDGRARVGRVPFQMSPDLTTRRGRLPMTTPWSEKPGTPSRTGNRMFSIHHESTSRLTPRSDIGQLEVESSFDEGGRVPSDPNRAIVIP